MGEPDVSALQDGGRTADRLLGNDKPRAAEQRGFRKGLRLERKRRVGRRDARHAAGQSSLPENETTNRPQADTGGQADQDRLRESGTPLEAKTDAGRRARQGREQSLGLTRPLQVLHVRVLVRNVGADEPPLRGEGRQPVATARSAGAPAHQPQKRTAEEKNPMSTKTPPWKVTALLTLTIALFAPAATTAAPETVSNAGTQRGPQRLPPEAEAATSSENRNSLTRTEVVVAELERRIDSLERRSRSLALDIAEQQLRELQRNRSRRSAQEREAPNGRLSRTSSTRSTATSSD